MSELKLRPPRQNSRAKLRRSAARRWLRARPAAHLCGRSSGENAASSYARCGARASPRLHAGKTGPSDPSSGANRIAGSLLPAASAPQARATPLPGAVPGPLWHGLLRQASPRAWEVWRPSRLWAFCGWPGAVRFSSLFVWPCRRGLYSIWGQEQLGFVSGIGRVHPYPLVELRCAQACLNLSSSKQRRFRLPSYRCQCPQFALQDAAQSIAHWPFRIVFRNPVSCAL